MAKNITNTQLISKVSAKVDALPDLTYEQREVVREIAVAAALKNGIYGEPNYGGIAHLVRSNANHQNNQLRPYPTNDTSKLIGAKQ